MSRTSISTLSKLALVSLLVSFGISKFSFIPINAGAPIALTILVFSMLVWVRMISSRLPKIEKEDKAVRVIVSQNPLPPLVAARTSAFALAGSRAGAILFGGYCGFVISDLGKLSADAYAEHALNCAISAVLSLLMVFISLWLERKCSPPAPTAE